MRPTRCKISRSTRYLHFVRFYPTDDCSRPQCNTEPARIFSSPATATLRPGTAVVVPLVFPEIAFFERKRRRGIGLGCGDIRIDGIACAVPRLDSIEILRFGVQTGICVLGYTKSRIRYFPEPRISGQTTFDNEPFFVGRRVGPCKQYR